MFALKIPRLHLLLLIAGASVALASLVHFLGTIVPRAGDPWAGMLFTPAIVEEEQQVERRSGAFFPAYLPGIVIQVLPGGPADRAGIIPGDLVISVGGIPTHEASRLLEETAALPPGSIVEYEILRADETVRTRIELAPVWRCAPYTAGFASSLALALLFSVFGLFVFLKRPADRRAALFYLMAVDVHALFLSLGSFSILLLTPVGMLSDRVLAEGRWAPFALYVVFGALLGPLLLHFALIFPRRRRLLQRNPGLLCWVYGLLLVPMSAIVLIAFFALLHTLKVPNRTTVDALLFFALLIALAGLGSSLLRTARARGWARALASRQVVPQLLMIVVLALTIHGTRLLPLEDDVARLIRVAILFVLLGLWTLGVTFVYPTLTCVTMFRSYRESGPEERAQVGWPLWGTILAMVGLTAVGVVGIGVSLFPGQHSTMLGIWLDVAGKAFYALLPVSFGVAILKYRLLDIEIVIRKTVVYSALTGLVVVLYLLLAGGLGGLLVRFAGLESQWIVIASTLAVAALLVPVRNRVQSFVDRRFYRERSDRPAALRAFSAGLRSAGRPGEVAELLALQVQRATRSRAVVVFGAGPSGGSPLRSIASVGLPDGLQERLRLAPSVMVDRDKPFTLDPGGSGREADLAKSLRPARARALVPVRGGERLHGAISVGGKLTGEPFSEEDLSFLDTIAGQAAVALENLALRARSEEVRGALEIQKHLLPETIPQPRGYSIAARWQPSRVVAGDSYDVLTLGGNRIGLCVADASGKGMPAALLMSNLQATVRSLAPSASSPAGLLRAVNGFLQGNVALGKFFTCFYAELDPDLRLLRYSNAGQNPPILLRADGRVERFSAGGMALGLFPDRDYDDGETRLGPGDLLILFTDGVTEPEDAEGAEFGEQRLIETLRAHRGRPAREVADAVMDAVTSFGAGELADDATLLVLAVDARPGSPAEPVSRGPSFPG